MSVETSIVVTAHHASATDTARITQALLNYADAHDHAAGFEQVNTTHPYLSGSPKPVWLGQVNYLDNDHFFDALTVTADTPEHRGHHTSLVVVLDTDAADQPSVHTLNHHGQWTHTQPF